MFPTATNNYNNCYEFSTSDHHLHQHHHQTLPPPYLFPFSPSLVKDVDEFVNSQHQLALLTHQYHSTTLPLMMMNTINDTSSETLADESFETTTTTTTTTNEPYTNANTNTNTAAAAAANTLDVVVDDDLGPPSNGKGTKQHHSLANYGKKARDLVAARAMKSQQSPRRRSKKDRHSKIVTAQGPRDRRMRLSLDIARRFFNLQDMLHFDKASKTVEWLLAKSRSAIKELSSRGFNSETKMISNCSTVGGSSTSSECEVVSGVVDADHDQSELLLLQDVTIIKSKEKRTRQAQRKTTLHPVEAKESRARARARARERTMERLLTRSQPQPQPPEENPNAQLRSSSITTDHEDQSCEELGTHQSFFVKSHTNKSLEVVTHEVVDHEKGCSHHSLENIIKKSTSASSSSIFNYTEGIAYSFNQNNNRGFVGIDENWDLQSLCTNTISNKNPSSTGEVFENYTPSTSCSSSMHNFDTHLQSQFADHNRRFSSYTAKPW